MLYMRISIYLQENITHAPVPEEVDEPEEEEADADDVVDEGMLRRELAPVLVNHLHRLLVDAVQVGGALGVHQVVVGVHVDPRLGGPRHLGRSCQSWFLIITKTQSHMLNLYILILYFFHTRNDKMLATLVCRQNDKGGILLNAFIPW